MRAISDRTAQLKHVSLVHKNLNIVKPLSPAAWPMLSPKANHKTITTLQSTYLEVPMALSIEARRKNQSARSAVSSRDGDFTMNCVTISHHSLQKAIGVLTRDRCPLIIYQYKFWQIDNRNYEHLDAK